MRWIWGLCLILALFFWSGEALAGQLAERLASFPNWDKPLVGAAEGDLVYPEWMEGTWRVTTTLVDLVAPLAPRVVTPGFASNNRYLNQPVSFTVRFTQAHLPLSSWQVPKLAKVSTVVVADRSFNGLNLAKAYLGDRAVLAVKVDPDSPNRQITLLRGERQLVSIITGRATESPNNGKFITTEVFQQVFRGTGRPYFNQVESTTAYWKLATADPAIEAEQVTAIYLSPQDPDYFTVGSRPVALYRYDLKFSRPSS